MERPVKIFFAGTSWIITDLNGTPMHNFAIKTGKKLVKVLNDNRLSLQNKNTILPELQAQLLF
ncbi:MAG TPA: hypothetical protein PLB74_03100 [Candidatus Paceibacterota bacterium]|jgi:hypothetical protein|nr:hypothetical protein [Candidatus Paceibacterota bacterium]